MKSVFDIEKPQAWGGSVLRQTACSKTVIENAIYLPMSSTIFFDIDPGWGIYDEEGDLVDGAAYERSPQRDLVGQSRHIDLSAITIEDSAVDEMIYCGPIIPHYGHFILSSLARLWAFDGTVPALFHSQPSLFEHETPFIQKYIAAVGLSRANAMSFSKPTRIRRLIVPEASLVEQDCVAKEYAVTGRKIGAALHGPADFVDRKFYLSKANLAGGVTGLEDEIVIERAFAEAGFEIIYPERLSVEEQVALFRDASMIVGFAGSGFHTVALVPDSKCLLLVFCFDYINSNFLLIDYGLVTKAVYHSVKEYVSRGGVSRFADAYKAHDIDALARIMLSTSLMQGQDMHQIIPSANDGESYLTYLPRMIGQRAAKNYLEVGVNTGDMLARIGVDTAVGVDPDFKLNQNVTKMKRDLTLIQEIASALKSASSRR